MFRRGVVGSLREKEFAVYRVAQDTITYEELADPKLKKVPIVMLTALVEENTASPTGETSRGGLSFVSKTSGLPTLLACIEKHTEDV